MIPWSFQEATCEGIMKNKPLLESVWVIVESRDLVPPISHTDQAFTEFALASTDVFKRCPLNALGVRQSSMITVPAATPDAEVHNAFTVIVHLATLIVPIIEVREIVVVEAVFGSV